MSSGCPDGGGRAGRRTGTAGAVSSWVGEPAPAISPDCPGTGEHGTLNAHRFHRCRCPEARRAHNRYRTQLRVDHLHGRRRTIDATGTHRRLQALTAIGWTDEALAAQLGVTRGALYQLRQRSKVYRPTERRVSALYNRLWQTPGPSSAARTRAADAGWLPPLWWDDARIDDPTYDPRADVHAPSVDEVAVARAMRGDRVPLTRPERLAAVAQLNAEGTPHREIARRLGVHDRQVLRDLTCIRLNPATSVTGEPLETRTTA